MIDTAKTAVKRVELSKYVGDPRNDYRQWRKSEQPAYHLIHGILETILVLGLAVRFYCHVTVYVIYYENKHKERCVINKEMLDFNNIVKPVLKPEDWHQAALMRGHTAIWGLFVLLMASNTYTAETLAATDDAGLRFAFITPRAIYWGKLFLATHLCLDPVLAAADRIANADLRSWILE